MVYIMELVLESLCNESHLHLADVDCYYENFSLLEGFLPFVENFSHWPGTSVQWRFFSNETRIRKISHAIYHS